MLMRGHSTKKLSASFPREMPACAKRARFCSQLAEKLTIRANGRDSDAGVAKHACRAQSAATHALPRQRQILLQMQSQGASLPDTEVGAQKARKRGRY
jgi:hypothetical protein